MKPTQVRAALLAAVFLLRLTALEGAAAVRYCTESGRYLAAGEACSPSEPGQRTGGRSNQPCCPCCCSGHPGAGAPDTAGGDPGIGAAPVDLPCCVLASVGSPSALAGGSGTEGRQGQRPNSSPALLWRGQSSFTGFSAAHPARTTDGYSGATRAGDTRRYLTFGNLRL